MLFSPTLLKKLWNCSPAEIAFGLSASSATVYLFACYTKSRQSTYRKSATKVEELKGLVELLQKRTTPLVVKVSGKVSSDSPIVCSLPATELESNSAIVPTVVHLHRDTVSCVVYEGKTEIVYEDRDINGDQFSSLMEVKSTYEEVPWYLEDDTAKVYVEGIHKAKGFNLIACKREVAGPGTTLLRELAFIRELDDHRGMKLLGVKHTECALKVDLVLTVVGEAVIDDSGKITIREPLFVCPRDKYKDTKSIVFGQSSPWMIGSIFAFVTSLLIFTTEGLKRYL